MSHGETFERHSMCTCGPFTFDGITSAGVVTIERCRNHAMSIYGIDPHPVLISLRTTEIMEAFLTRSRRDC